MHEVRYSKKGTNIFHRVVGFCVVRRKPQKAKHCNLRCFCFSVLTRKCKTCHSNSKDTPLLLLRLKLPWHFGSSCRQQLVTPGSSFGSSIIKQLTTHCTSLALSIFLATVRKLPKNILATACPLELLSKRFIHSAVVAQPVVALWFILKGHGQ